MSESFAKFQRTINPGPYQHQMTRHSLGSDDHHLPNPMASHNLIIVTLDFVFNLFIHLFPDTIIDQLYSKHAELLQFPS